MSEVVLPRAALVVAISIALTSGCRSDHRVSPWPENLGIESFVVPPDLQNQLERVDRETRLENLAKVQEIRGTFADRSAFVVLGFAGEGAMRGQRTAVRVATGHGVILALGPRDPADLVRGSRCRLVSELAQGGGWRSGSDLNGDGHPDVVVRGEDDAIEVWYLMPKGASPYPVTAVVLPDHAMDVDEDGRPDLAGQVRMPGEDAIGPVVVEVVTFQSGAYRNDTQAVRDWHRRELRRLEAQGDGDAGVDAGMRRPDDRAWLARALERAWHAIRSGEQPNKALEVADAASASRAPLGHGLSQSWVRWRGWLGDLVR